MAENFEVKIQGAFLRNPEGTMKIFDEEIERLISELTAYAQRQVFKYTPFAFGDLQSSIQKTMRGKGIKIEGRVLTPSSYGRFVETGLPAHYPNIDNLAKWVRLKLGISDERKLVRITRLVARKIKRFGISPSSMFLRAYMDTESFAQSLIKRTETAFIQRLS